MTAGYWTAMADVLIFSNGYVSSCFTINPEEAQGKEFINWSSSLKGFDFSCFKLCWGSGYIIPKIDDLLICSCRLCEQTQRQWIPITNAFWHTMQKLGEQLRLFHAIFNADPMLAWSFYFWSCFRIMPSSKNTAWLKTKWVIT